MLRATPLRQPGYPLLLYAPWIRGFASSGYPKFAIIGEILFMTETIAHYFSQFSHTVIC